MLKCFMQTPVLLMLLPLVAQAMQYQAVPAPAAPAAPYNYQYGVKDDYTKTNFAKTEARDSNVSGGQADGQSELCLQGNVKGTFVISLPDGRIQTTTYTADPLAGFVAKVSYQGEPVYPDPSTYTVTATV